MRACRQAKRGGEEGLGGERRVAWPWPASKTSVRAAPRLSAMLRYSLGATRSSRQRDKPTKPGAFVVISCARPSIYPHPNIGPKASWVARKAGLLHVVTGPVNIGHGLSNLKKRRWGRVQVPSRRVSAPQLLGLGAAGSAIHDWLWIVVSQLAPLWRLQCNTYAGPSVPWAKSHVIR